MSLAQQVAALMAARVVKKFSGNIPPFDKAIKIVPSAILKVAMTKYFASPDPAFHLIIPADTTSGIMNKLCKTASLAT